MAPAIWDLLHKAWPLLGPAVGGLLATVVSIWLERRRTRETERTRLAGALHAERLASFRELLPAVATFLDLMARVVRLQASSPLAPETKALQAEYDIAYRTYQAVLPKHVVLLPPSVLRVLDQVQELHQRALLEHMIALGQNAAPTGFDAQRLLRAQTLIVEIQSAYEKMAQVMRAEIQEEDLSAVFLGIFNQLPSSKDRQDALLLKNAEKKT